MSDTGGAASASSAAGGGGGGGGGGSSSAAAADPSWGFRGSGPHPLDGVPNHRELPPPEPLPPGSKVLGLEPADVNVRVGREEGLYREASDAGPRHRLTNQRSW